MRVVLDTNVVVSALLWGGTPERLIKASGGRRIELVTTEALVAELAGILARAKFAAKLRQKKVSAIENSPVVGFAHDRLVDLRGRGTRPRARERSLGIPRHPCARDRTL